MKRHEARTEIAKLLTGKDYASFGELKKAEEFLTKLETLGMKPPCLPDKYCQALLDVYIDPDFNQWEERVEEDVRVMERVKKREEWNRGKEG